MTSTKFQKASQSLDLTRVEEQTDSKLPNTSLFTIYTEDHTLGNIVKKQLMEDSFIRFSGYRKPHPLENKIEIKIQTNGEETPRDALKLAFKQLTANIDDVTKKFSVRK